MNILVTDTQQIGETLVPALSMLQQGPVGALVTMKNSGVNTLNYTWQELVSGVWTSLGVLGTDFNSTLVAGQSKAIHVSSANSQVRLVANASGGSILEFAVLRWSDRTSGGAIPILNF